MDNSQNLEPTFTLNLTAIYFNMARSFSSETLVSKIDEYIKEGGNFERGYKVGYGLISGACIYSYLAIESYVNNQLFQINKEIITIKNNIKDIKNRNYTFGFEDKNFMMPTEKYINRTETKEKLRNLCIYEQIPFHYQADEQLWNKFTQLLTDTRHFMIHPKPYEEYFQETMAKIFNNYAPGDYIETAEEIIGYYYDKRGVDRPVYLIGNSLFVLDNLTII